MYGSTGGLKKNLPYKTWSFFSCIS